MSEIYILFSAFFEILKYNELQKHQNIICQIKRFLLQCLKSNPMRTFGHKQVFMTCKFAQHCSEYKKEFLWQKKPTNENKIHMIGKAYFPFFLYFQVSSCFLKSCIVLEIKYRNYSLIILVYINQNGWFSVKKRTPIVSL